MKKIKRPSKQTVQITGIIISGVGAAALGYVAADKAFKLVDAYRVTKLNHIMFASVITKIDGKHPQIVKDAVDEVVAEFIIAVENSLPVLP